MSSESQNKYLSSLWSNWGRCFALDVRSLALFRFLLGLTIIFDLLARLEDFRANYTDEGILPRSSGIAEILDQSYFCIHLAFGTWYGQAMLFLFSGICAFCLALGYRTRTATILSWIMMASLQSRNTMVGDGADTMLRVILFWAMFLPLGAVYSLDSVFAPKDSKPPADECSIFSFGYIIQLSLVYWMACILKYHPIWRSDGLGVFFALHLDMFTLPLGYWVREHEPVYRALNYATLLLEGGGPLLLLVPFWRAKMRMLAVLSFILFHASLGLMMALGTFPGVGILCWLTLLPPELWSYFRVPLDFENAQKLRIAQRLERIGFMPEIPLPKEPSSAAMRIATLTVAQLFAGLSLLYIILWNIRTADFERFEPLLLPKRYNWIGQLMRFDQDWSLFAPKPLADDGWYVIPGTLRNGKIIDVWTKGELSWEKPVPVVNNFINQRWRKYLINIYEARYAPQRLHFARYLCRDWNSSHEEDELLETFNIVFMLERTTAQGPLPPTPTVIWSHDCMG